MRRYPSQTERSSPARGWGEGLPSSRARRGPAKGTMPMDGGLAKERWPARKAMGHRAGPAAGPRAWGTSCGDVPGDGGAQLKRARTVGW